MMRALRFLPPSMLRPHEETVDARLREVLAFIVSEQVWTRPICVEEESLCIMDGHHRRLAAIHLGLAVVPVVSFAYDEVLLGSWTQGEDRMPDELLERSRTGRLLPPKSTRHVFPPHAIQAVPLAFLIDGGAGAIKPGAARGG